MVDPSLLVARRTSRRILQHVRNADESYVRFYLPHSFVQVLQISDRRIKDKTMRFFRANATPLEPSEEEILIAESRKLFLSFKSSNTDREKYHEIWQYLSVRYGSEKEYLSSIIFEEWGFLMRHSWLGARIRKVFDSLIEAGGIGITVARGIFDKIIRSTIKEYEKPLKQLDYFRALCKWIAVAGPTSISLIDSSFIDPSLFALGSGIFLLVDP
jgi:hypothetical protein